MEKIKERFDDIKKAYSNAKNYGDYPTITETEALMEDIDHIIFECNEMFDELRKINVNLYGL